MLLILADKNTDTIGQMIYEIQIEVNEGNIKIFYIMVACKLKVVHVEDDTLTFNQ